MELGDASDEGAPPPCLRKREMLKYLWLQMISMLQSMQCNDGLWRGVNHHHHQKVRSGMQHSILTMGVGRHAHMPWVILFLQKLIPGKKLQETCYISNRVHPGGCQGCPAVEEAYPKKTCNINGGIKDNCALVDC